MTTVGDIAFDLAAIDDQPARKSVYLKPLVQLRRDCRERSVDELGAAVESLAHRLAGLGELPAPAATAASALAVGIKPGANCAALAGAIGDEVGGHFRHSGDLSRMVVRFSPALTSELALAAIRHSLLPGKVRAVYELKAFSCQQAIYMGAGLAHHYGNPDLGAFVELTSGKGVGSGKYDANRVNRARITPFGKRGGQPCT